MPVPGQPALTTIAITKELEQTYQGLHLVELTFPDGSVLRLSSENLDSTNGGVQWNGHDWLPRLKQQTLDQISSVSNNGIVQSPQVTIGISDADKSILTAWEWANNRGFKGAQMKIYFVYADLIAGTFSSDSRVVFLGRCNPPQADPTSLTVTADNMLNLSKRYLPTAQCSKNCIWDFPTTAAQRQDGADNPDSPYYNCGYSPDATGSNARGNLDGSGNVFTYCNKDKVSCVYRLGNDALPWTNAGGNAGSPVAIEQDKAGRHTGRFSGSTWAPPLDWRGKRYISGTKEQGINNPNDARIGKYYPLIWGKCMVDALPMATAGDPNTTRFECVVAIGELGTDLNSPGPIEAVIVNDQVVPHKSQTSDQNFAWNWLNTGGRDGHVNHGPVYDSAGDPYGGLAVIVVVVPYDVVDSSSTPNVKVVTTGIKVKVFSADSVTAYTEQVSTNPVWTVFDMLCRTNYTPAQLDISSFIQWAAYADAVIGYTKLDGTAATHERYRAGMFYNQVRSASECLTNFLASFGGMLRNGPDGRLQILMKTTLAEQQPNPIPSSNNQNPIASVNAAGAAANGYLAYDFNESNIKLTEGGKTPIPSLSFSTRPANDTPNRISVSFQDEEAHFVQDSLTVADQDDVLRMGNQEIRATVSPEGVVNFDQASRILQVLFSENYRGNPRASTIWPDGKDSGGTLFAKFTTTAKAIDLRCGDLIRISSVQYNITALFRVTGIRPSADGEDFELNAQWHKDIWYVDGTGQPQASGSGPAAPPTPPTPPDVDRSPFAWSPIQVTPGASDALWQRPTFSVTPSYITLEGETAARYQITGHQPVNQLSATLGNINIPTIYSAVGDTAAGTIPAGTYWLVLVAIDANGQESGISAYESVTLASAGEITLSGLLFPTGASSYKLFAGTDPARMTLQVSGSGTPASLVLSSYSVTGEGAPDELLNNLDLIATLVPHPGVWAEAITGASDTTIQIANAGWTANQWAGRVVSVIGKGLPKQAVPICNRTVASNTADTLTLTTGGLAAAGIVAGDIVTLRAIGSTASATSIGDAGFVNSAARLGTPILLANILPTTPVEVATQTPHGLNDGDTILLSKTRVGDGTYTVTTIDPFLFTVNGTTGSAFVGYSGGGLMQTSGSGLTPSAEVGRLVRIIAGKGAGQVAAIIGNDASSVTIANPWAITPDSTSIWIITESGPIAEMQSAALLNPDPANTISLNFATAGGIGATLLIQGFTQNSTGQRSRDAITPAREVYVPAPVLNAYATIQGVQQQSYTFGPDSGAANAYALTQRPVPVIVLGSRLQFVAAHANTGPSTVAVNGTAYPLTKNGATALAAGDIVAGQVIDAIFDGTRFQIISPAGTPVTGLAGNTGAGYGSWYGQVPRGTVDGSNRTFQLDYKLLNPYTVLQRGTIQMPSLQGVPGAPFQTQPVPGGQFTIDGYTLTTAVPPQPRENWYIEYFRAEERPLPNGLVLTVRTAWTAGVAGNNGASSLYGTNWAFGHLPWLTVAATTPPTDYSLDVTHDPVSGDPINPDTFFVSFFIEGGANGASDGTWDVYDAYLTGTYSDGSTVIYRPTRAATLGGPSAHLVNSPPAYQESNAIDGDPNTAARIQSDNWSASGLGYGLGGEFELRLDQFVPVSSTPPPTPVAPVLANVTAQNGSYPLPANLTGQTIDYTGSAPATFTLPAPVAPPPAPALGQVSGGSHAATTYYVQQTYVNASGETVASPVSALAVGANSLLTAASPPAPPAAAGVTGYNVYAGTSPASLTKQNFAPVAIGTGWAEAPGGLVPSTIAPPTVSTASPGAGYSATVVNTGTGTVTLSAPAGTTLNGSTGSVTLQPGQSADVYYNPATANYTVVPTAAGGASIPAAIYIDGVAVSYDDTITFDSGSGISFA